MHGMWIYGKWREIWNRGDKRMKCECGFEFSESGEYRNCNAKLTKEGWVNICPNCGKEYLNEANNDS